MSRTVTVLDAIVIKDASYPSGKIVFNLGDKVEVVKTGKIYFIYTPQRRCYDEVTRNDFAYSTDNVDWIWEHLVLEGMV